jgi:lysophospholipase L1-like esterase
VSNSQGTSAGLPESGRWRNYPSLIQDSLPNDLCCYWMMSELSVDTVDGLFNEIVLQHKPDVVFLQCGIIEAALRVLPRSARHFLRTIKIGIFVTKFLHDRRFLWLKFLDKFGIRFFDIDKKVFGHHINTIINKCRINNIKISVIKIPLLSEACEGTILPGNNYYIDEYNSVIESICNNNSVPFIEPFEGNSDRSRNSLYIDNTVHFSLDGHMMIAKNILGAINV